MKRQMVPLRSSVPERDQAELRGDITIHAAIHSVADLGAALRAESKVLVLTQADLALAAGVGLRFVVELEVWLLDQCAGTLRHRNGELQFQSSERWL